jgi:DNA-binding MarR family transcriptional regulator
LTEIAAGAVLKLDTFLPYRLTTTAHFVSVALSRIYANQGLSIPEWRILSTLCEFGTMTARDVCGRTLMHKTKVSRCVVLMEKRRLLSRSRNRTDLREIPLSASATGRRLYEEVVPRALEFEAKVLAALGPTERDAFYVALEKIKTQVL